MNNPQFYWGLFTLNPVGILEISETKLNLRSFNGI